MAIRADPQDGGDGRPAGPGQAGPRERSRTLRAAAWIAGTLLLAYGGAQAALRRACADGALRARIAAALSAQLGPVELGPDVRVDPLFRVRFGPLTVPGARPGDAALVHVESIRVRPDLRGLLRTGRAVPASVRLETVRIDLPDRPGALAELATRLSPRSRAPRGSPAPAGAAPLPALHVRDLTVEFTALGRRATAGPLQATVRSGAAPDGSLTVSASLALPGAGRGVVDLRREGAGWRATARLDDLAPGAVPAGLTALPATWDDGAVQARLDAVLTPARRQARVQVDLTARRLRVGGPVLGAEPLGPLDLAFSGELSWDGRARRLHLGRSRLELPGGAPVAIEASLGLSEGLPLALRARAEAVDYLATVAALPAALGLPPEAPHPAGTLDAHLAVTGPLLDPAAWQVDAGLDLSRMRREARRAPPVALAGPFVQHVEADGAARDLALDPASPDFVPLDELPRHVVRAVTTSEDAGFFGHSGFDFEELRNAAVQGAQAGKVVRGGSTITQQLAKNLYLTREKTLARKLREAVLTVALEATLTKPRLLEIYLNVAEWGPGVWGIGPAARHWFGKDARALTPKEAAFLATVIPNPVRYHYMWSRGWLSDHWEERVEGLLRTMASQGSLTDEELAGALAQPLTFARCAAGADDPADGVTCRGT